MTQKLTNQNRGKSKGTMLTTAKVKFRIAIEDRIKRGFNFKDMAKNHNREFQRFIDDTVGKGLTITQVDQMFKRNRGPVKRIEIEGETREEVHYGKDRNAFRVFGYYNNEGYFVLSKIDPKHKTHK